MAREKLDAGSCDCGTGRPRASLHPVVIRPLSSEAAANEQGPSWIEADPAERDAPISVWWDYPPIGGM